jgi:TolA-binding protein
VSALDQANRAFLSGSYDEAVRNYEDYLRTTPPGSGQRDEALFHLGLIFASRPAPGTDWPRAISNFKQLTDEYPNSPLRPEASLILSLRTELDQAAGDVKKRDERIRQLTTELDRLKKIDADRRKRP